MRLYRKIGIVAGSLVVAALSVPFAAMIASGPATSTHQHGSRDGSIDPMAVTMQHGHGTESAAQQAITASWEWESPPRVGEPVTVTITLADTRGGAVALDVMMEEKAHLVVVDDDASEFQHVHPLIEGATLTTQITFREGGAHRVALDISPAGVGPTTRMTEVSVEGSAAAAPLPETEVRAAEADGIRIAFEAPGELPSAVPVELQWRFTDAAGTPFTGMQPYLGSIGHLVVVRPSDGWVQHVHPLNWASSGPTAVFGIVFPEPGRYVLWAQFAPRENVVSVPFTVDVG